MVISEFGLCRMLVYEKLTNQNSSHVERIRTAVVNARRSGRNCKPLRKPEGTVPGKDRAWAAARRRVDQGMLRLKKSHYKNGLLQISLGFVFKVVL